MDLKSSIISLTKKYGFHKAGFSGISQIDRTFFFNWLGQGKQASMQWLETSKEKRLNPYLIFPEVKTVISLAYIYDTPFEHQPGLPLISRYAWGKDYHKILKTKLKSLCKDIELLKNGISTKYYVDDGPVMEKYWAVKSGIGWLGKNSNVIIPDIGSFFFLSEIFLNKELEDDKEITDMCETCNICLSACPTGALETPYSVDSGKCISYHTIENRGEIPAEINLNGWIFGCDICQDVCPYNNKKIFTCEKEFYPNPSIFNKSSEELNSLSEEEFNETFKDSPIKRTKHKGWKRNLKLFSMPCE